MMTSSVGRNKDSLLKRLARILDVGDDDNEYITDVLDQLIDIGEDADDVTSYLTSFLGGDDAGDDVLQFANDVRRFKLGEEIIETVDNPSTKPDTTFVGAEKHPSPKQENYTTHDRQLQRQQKEEKKTKKRQPNREALTAEIPSRATSVQSSEIKRKPEKNEVVGQSNNGGPSKPKNNQACSSTVQRDPPKPQGSKHKTSPMKEHQKPLPEIKKGKAKKVCGCFGTKHKPLTNCLHCGRISCEAEGYDFCPFCHILIEDFSTRIRSEQSSSSALLHKERLLEFDRTAKARTLIFDDQEDYFVASSSMWSTNEEQQGAKEKEEERRKLLHERRKQTLSINF